MTIQARHPIFGSGVSDPYKGGSANARGGSPTAADLSPANQVAPFKMKRRATMAHKHGGGLIHAAEMIQIATS